MRYLLPLLLTLWSASGSAQNLPDRLSAYFNFDICDIFDESGNGSTGALVGNPNCVCGARDSAFRFDGFNDAILLVGPVGDVFTTSDFSVVFYMKPLPPPSAPGATQMILSKQNGCTNDNAFWVRYRYSTQTITSTISESDSLLVTVSARLDNDPCWQQVVLVRNNMTYSLYVNGVLRDSKTSSKRINLSAATTVKVSEPQCPLDNYFFGDLDELQFYNKALSPDEVNQVNFRPDQIVNGDTLIYLGNSLGIQITETCATGFEWTPTTGVQDVFSPTTLITPTETTTYTLQFKHPDNCIAQDHILVSVIDPDTLDCTQIFIPNAFTPNASPGRNDRFGISNPFAVNDFISFELFDRWGGRVFNATSPFETWDGTFQGKPVNPGIFLYRLYYRCQGEEKVLSGTLTVLK